MYVCISAISAAGKTTIGKELANILNVPFLDLDSFFVRDKPLVTLSSGKRVKNWDCEEALNVAEFQRTVMELVPNGLVVVGFALTDDILPAIKPDIHFHLVTSKYEEDIIDKCIAGRRQSKVWKEDAIRTDELMVREILYPFYRESLMNTSIDYWINVYRNGKRRHVMEVINDMLYAINNLY